MSKKLFKPFLLILFLMNIVFSQDNYIHRLNISTENDKKIKEDYPEFKELYFANKFDHFNPTETRTYQQRYFRSDKYFDEKNGAIFVYICGESTCNVPTTRMFAYKLAQEHNAMLLIVEHRYYGKSQLFTDWSTENMKLLTVENGLADLANFIQSMQKDISDSFKDGPLKRKVITIGGSYPGAMSAWLRYKYPHVTDGSLASSAVVNAVYDFNAFDEQIIESMKKTPGCLELAGKWVKLIEYQQDSGDQSQIDYIYNIFGAGPKFDKADFMSYINGIFGEKVQYGGRSKMCEDFFKFNHQSIDDELKALAKYAGEAGTDGISMLQSTKIDWKKNMRQWTWQICTQVGFLFTPSKNSPLTSKKLDLKYWVGVCKRTFGIDMNPKAGIDELNMILGGDQQKGSNIFFTNGVEDGWQWASVRNIKEKNTSMEAHVIDCDDCAHCVDLSGEKADDPKDLVATRARIRIHINNWVTGNGFPENFSQNNNYLKYLIE